MRRRLRPRPRFWLFLILLMIAGFGLSCAVSQVKRMQVDARVAALEAEKMALTERIRALEKQYAYVQTDAYIERVARDELNMIYPGEIRYVSN